MHKKVFLGEFIGTFFLVLFGCGSVAADVAFGAHSGLFQIGIIWGVAVTLGIYATRHLSCAHFNPAVTVAMVATKRLEPKLAPTYLLGQCCGAFAGALAVYGLFHTGIAAYEEANGIIRGTVESMASAKMFGEYYYIPQGSQAVGMGLAFAAELFGTFMLVFNIFCLTEECNPGRPSADVAPIFVGLTVSSMLCLIAPLTQAGLNPARDFIPRLVACIFGWGKAAFPDSQGGAFWVYILAPILGGLLAGLFFTRVVEPALRKKSA